MMSLRKMGLVSFFVKKSPIFKQCPCTYHVSHVDNIANDTKLFAIENRNVDKLTSELDTFSTSSILTTLENNKKIINGSHLVCALNQFLKFYSQGFFNQKDGCGIWDNANAKKLCWVIDLNVYKLSVTECVKLLDLFGKMEAPDSMKVVQSLRNRINFSIKNLSLVDFPTVYLSLIEMPKTSLVKDLRKTLERKFIVKIASEYDPNNINHIESALYFTAYSLDSTKLLTLFIDDLNNYKGEIPISSAIIIFKSVSAMKQYPPGWLDLLRRIQNILIEQVHELSTAQVERVLLLIKKCSRSNHEEFYNQMLCDVLVKKIIADDSGFDSAFSALKCLKSVRHVNREILNYTSAIFFERIHLSNEVIQFDIFKIMTLIDNLSMVKHKTVFFNEIKDYVLNNKSLLDCNYKVLCTLTFNLVNLDCYPIEILNKVFDGKGNYNAEQGKLLYRTFCNIYQKIKTNPMYEGPLPSKSQIIELKKFYYQKYLQYKNSSDRILCCLEAGMGAPIYVKSYISSKLFHIIDYAVAFNKDGSPIPINAATNIDGKSDSAEYVEDLNVPPGSQIVLILLTSDHWYTRNTKELISYYSCSGETLEALSYPVVYINQRTFNETPDEEKIAMLMSQIRSKLVQN